MNALIEARTTEAYVAGHLSEEDLGRLTAKNESEDLLDRHIKEQEEAINRAKVARGQVALRTTR